VFVIDPRLRIPSRGIVTVAGGETVDETVAAGVTVEDEDAAAPWVCETVIEGVGAVAVDVGVGVPLIVFEGDS